MQTHVARSLLRVGSLLWHDAAAVWSISSSSKSILNTISVAQSCSIHSSSTSRDKDTQHDPPPSSSSSSQPPPPAPPSSNPMQAALAAVRPGAPLSVTSVHLRTASREIDTSDPAAVARARHKRQGRTVRGRVTGISIRQQQLIKQQEVPIQRSWSWYDARDEREERKRETAVQYLDAGHAHYQGIPQSIKKMRRIVKLVRTLHIDEAITQCKLVPHKAAKYVVEAIEHAKKDALDKNLNADLLVVSTIFCTKGVTIKALQMMGKGGMGKKFTRKCHLQVVLREDQQYTGFKARLVSTQMSWKQPSKNFPYATVV
ncbi:MAG: hypothetical protein WDW38_008751 [Sanguina aurantia]